MACCGAAQTLMEMGLACYDMLQMTSDLGGEATVLGSSEHGSQFSGSIQDNEFLYKLSDYRRSQWPRDLTHELSSLARILRSWV
jgi:hypothetical protein